MDTTTLDTYNLLIDAGIKKEVAEPLAKQIITQADAKKFATKEDVADLKVEIERSQKQNVMWMVGLHIASLGVIIALFT